MPLLETLMNWTKHTDKGGRIEPIANAEGSFLRLTAQNSDANLSQTGTVPAGAESLILRYRLRVFSLTSGEKFWHSARIALLWKNDPNSRHHVTREFEPSGNWQTGELHIPINPERTQFNLWIGMAKCTGKMDISSVSLHCP